MYFNPATQPDTSTDDMGGSGGFKHYLQKSRLSYSLLPETKFFNQKRAGSATNKLMRARTLADYGVSLGDGSFHKSRYFIGR